MDKEREKKLRKVFPYILIVAILIMLEGFFVITAFKVVEITSGIGSPFIMVAINAIGLVTLLALVFSLKPPAPPRTRAISVLGPTLSQDVFRKAIFEHEISQYFRELGIEAYRSKILEGENMSHEFDIVTEKEGKIFVIEVKHRSIVPSDIENFSNIYDDLKAKNERVKGIFIVTAKEATESVQLMAKQKGIQIVDFKNLKTLSDYIL